MDGEPEKKSSKVEEKTTSSMFRKRGKKKRRGNKRKLSVSDGNEEDVNTSDVALLKKMRSRRKAGLDVKRLMIQGSSSSIKKNTLSVQETSESSEVKKRKLDGLLKGSFSAASNVERIDTNELMEKYVKERMGESMNESEKTKKRSNSEVDDVYRVPDDLRTNKKKNEESGGPVAFGTGIAEVELPDEYRLRNIEETELAKSRMLMGGSGGRKRERPVDGRGNMSSNYMLHQKNREDKEGKSSDKNAFNKFISKERRSGWR